MTATAANSSTTIMPGDRVVALDPEDGRRYLLHLDGAGARKVPGLGVLDPGRFEHEPWGSRHTVGQKEVVLLSATLPDLAATLRRKAQIITPKDASRLVWELGLGPGDRVLESGIGSGAMTLTLAHAVQDEGHVFVQELREDFADWATANLHAAGMSHRVTVCLGDLTEKPAADIAAAADPATGGRPFDAVLLDQPEPWAALPNVLPMLIPGARIACYVPQVSQMEKTAVTLANAGCLDVRCMELIQREWKVGERGSRPANGDLGFTAFLVFARTGGNATATGRGGSG